MISPQRRPTNLYLLRGPDGLDDVLAMLRHGPLATDTETTGLSWRDDRVGSINLAAGTTAVFAYKNALPNVLRWLHTQVRHLRSLVFHHAKYDLHMLRGTFGFHVPYPVHDTMLQSFLIDNRGVHGKGYTPGHGLKSLATAYVDETAQEPQQELLAAIKARGGKGLGDWLLAPWRLYAKYSALDAWYTLQLHQQFMSRIRHWSQPEGYPSLLHLYENERWLVLALRDMEERGILVDAHWLQQWQRRLLRQLVRAKTDLRRSVHGAEINWNSTPQLRALLYGQEHLGLEQDRLTGTQQQSTDKIALLRLRHPVGAALLTYRQLYKQYHTDAAGLLAAQWEDGTIHATFNQNVRTGRMSCADPNLQQENRRSGIRRAFIPRKGLVLRFADYSQIEMRFAAHLANEPTLVAGFKNDPLFDTHGATAQRMFGVRQPTDVHRDHGKTMNFAMLFGAGENTVTEGLISRMTVKEARQGCIELGYRPSAAESPHRALASLLRTRYSEMMPAMRTYVRFAEKNAKLRGFAINLFGRLRYLGHEETYKAFNTEVQGSAADQMKFGLVAVYKELQRGTGELALLVQVHDEIIYESAGDPRTDRRVLECLQDLQTFRVPITATISGSRKSWQHKRALSL